MLAVSKYQKEYIDDCKTKMRAQLDVYRKLIAECKNKEGKNEPSLYIAIDYFEAEFFNNLVILLDALFVHRLRDKEGKEENPLNEVGGQQKNYLKTRCELRQNDMNLYESLRYELLHFP